MNPTRWTAQGLLPALLCLCFAQPVHAQGGLLKKLQEKTNAIAEKDQRADNALNKAGQTVEAVHCLASDSTCAAPAAPSDTLARRPESGFQPLLDTSKVAS
jgi:hypothetical protein